MNQDSPSSAQAAITTAAELEFRRYEARLGVWKVVLGTVVVGLAGVLIPGAISFYTEYFENARKETEIQLSQQAAHQQYIKDFFATAINQDIELRIRFAHYFANLSGPGQEQLWTSYLEDLKELRDQNRKKINELEAQLVEFRRMPPGEIDNAEFDRINRELLWANTEVGYVPTERSTVSALPDSSPIRKKIRLYNETTDLVQKMASGTEPVVEQSADMVRFWALYREDLIGVESPEFARTMIAIGRVLRSLAGSQSPPNDELKRLAVELASISRGELADISQATVQRQQEQQARQQQLEQQQQHQQQQQRQEQLPMPQESVPQ